jgi:hypothetical protein
MSFTEQVVLLEGLGTLFKRPKLPETGSLVYGNYWWMNDAETDLFLLPHTIMKYSTGE